MSDVIVIGGGVIGCAAAHRLAARGASVTLLDPRPPGHGASRASAGMLAPYTEGRHDQALQRLGGLGLARYDAIIAELDAAGERVPFRRHGSIDVALDEEGVRVLDEIVATLPGAAAHERLDGEALRALEPHVSARAAGGLLIASHGAVDVPRLVKALWARAESLGARLLHGAAIHVRQGSAGVEVETTVGRHQAASVVLAAGCWSAGVGLDEAVRPVPVQPVRGQLVILEGEPGILTHTLWGPGCYLVPWADGRVMVGATVEHVGFDERSTAEGVRGLLETAIELVPALQHAAFAEVRVGLRPGSHDDRPVVGRSAVIEGLIYATGHYRNGALLAPLTADAVADLIAGAVLDEAWAPCAPARFGL